MINRNMLAGGNAHRFIMHAYASGLTALNRRPSPVVSILGAVALTAISSAAQAQTAYTGGTEAGQMLNNICTFILGAFGQTLAVLGIIGIGMAWMFGRASLGLIAGVIGGIVIMFGASYLGSALTSAGSGSGTTS